jgi:hypothetical protein
MIVEATLDPREMLKALKTLMPSRRYKSMREPAVLMVAGPGQVIVTGTLGASASVASTTKIAGNCVLPLDTVARLLSVVPKSKDVVIKSDGEYVWLDSTRVKMPPLPEGIGGH